MFLAGLVMFCVSALSFSNEAQAQLSFELLGKVGAGANWEGLYADKNDPTITAFYGDSLIDVAGGLEFGVLLRFEMGFAVGLNFNWNMFSQYLDEVSAYEIEVKEKKEEPAQHYIIDTTDLTKKQRRMTVQHPSIGLTLRYAFVDMFEVGIWVNYGFGSISMQFDTGKEGIFFPEYNGESFDWDLQTFEFGLLAQLSWRIPSTTLSVLVGAHVFCDYSRVLADDTSLIDESDLTTFGFTFNVGARFDIYLDAFGARRPRD